MTSKLTRIDNVLAIEKYEDGDIILYFNKKMCSVNSSDVKLLIQCLQEKVKKEVKSTKPTIPEQKELFITDSAKRNSALYPLFSKPDQVIQRNIVDSPALTRYLFNQETGKSLVKKGIPKVKPEHFMYQPKLGKQAEVSKKVDIPKQVQKEEGGWGVNVFVNSKIERRIYKTRIDARIAKGTDKIGENGRIR